MRLPDGFEAAIAAGPLEQLNWDVTADWVAEFLTSSEQWEKNLRWVGKTGIRPVRFESFPTLDRWGNSQDWRAFPQDTPFSDAHFVGYGYCWLGQYPVIGTPWAMPRSLLNKLRYEDTFWSRPKQTKVYPTTQSAARHLVRACSLWDGVF